jgi:hypothetical protein
MTRDVGEQGEGEGEQKREERRGGRCSPFVLPFLW